MPITRTVSSKVETSDPHQGLTAGAAKEWLDTVPDRAKVSAITRDTGTQRDPFIVTVGLRARWEE